MGIWQFFSKFTVLEPEDCSAPFPISLKLVCTAGSWLPLPLFLCLLCPPGWADQTIAPGDFQPSPSAVSDDAAVSEDTEMPIAPAPPAASAPQTAPIALPSAPASLVPAQSPRRDRTASKTLFLQQKPSRRAADLLTSPVRSNAPVFAPVAAPTHEWLVAATQLPLLDQAIPDPLAIPIHGDGAGARSPAALSPLASVRVAADPANPSLPPTFENCDPELGCLRIQGLPPSTAPQPILYLTPRVDFFRSNNLLLGIDPINAGLIRPSLTLLAIPRIGPNTYVLASVDGAFNRYFEVPQFNYDELRIRAGILHQLSPTMTAEVGWTNQQLFIANNEIPGFPSGTRFLNDQAIRFELSRRDQLTERLFLNSIYQFRVSFSDPEDRSRILNVGFLSLNWDLNPNRTVQLGMDYQFSAANYTVVKRTDIYQQLLGRITLNAFRNSQLSVYGGISFGDSTERGIDFNSYVLGVSMSVNWTLF